MSRQLCKHHPDIDYRHHWGCPECLRELKIKNEKLTEAMDILVHDEIKISSKKLEAENEKLRGLLQRDLCKSKSKFDEWLKRELGG